MLRFVNTAMQEIAPYAEYTPDDRLERIKGLAERLRGCRILHLNATPYGGGVAELLNSIVPLERGLGLDVAWGVIVAEASFFELTKRLHNGLQGDRDFHVYPAEADAYLLQNRAVAEAIGDAFDIVVVHDPQPAPTRCLSPKTKARWIWRIHLDLSEYNSSALAFVEPYIRDYDALVFTMPEFVPEPLRGKRIHCFPPAIDPLSPKNLVLPGEITDRIVRWLGVHLDRPLMTQVSRFDLWKDPLGVLRVYREVRKRHPSLQLAMLGSMAQDDPQGWEIYSQIREDAGDDPDIHIGSNFTGIGNIEVNAFQRRSNVVIQKSIREGFGLVVSETVWKGTPIVAGNTGGIPLQVQDGQGGFLISKEEDWVERMDELLTRPAEATRIAELGRERVRDNFLITRLLEDELQLLATLA